MPIWYWSVSLIDNHNIKKYWLWLVGNRQPLVSQSDNNNIMKLLPLAISSMLIRYWSVITVTSRNTDRGWWVTVSQSDNNDVVKLILLLANGNKLGTKVTDRWADWLRRPVPAGMTAVWWQVHLGTWAHNVFIMGAVILFEVIPAAARSTNFSDLLWPCHTFHNLLISTIRGHFSLSAYHFRKCHSGGEVIVASVPPSLWYCSWLLEGTHAY